MSLLHLPSWFPPVSNHFCNCFPHPSTPCSSRTPHFHLKWAVELNESYEPGTALSKAVTLNPGASPAPASLMARVISIQPQCTSHPCNYFTGLSGCSACWSPSSSACLCQWHRSPRHTGQQPPLTTALQHILPRPLVFTASSHSGWGHLVQVFPVCIAFPSPLYIILTFPKFAQSQPFPSCNHVTLFLFHLQPLAICCRRLRSFFPPDFALSANWASCHCNQWIDWSAVERDHLTQRFASLHSKPSFSAQWSLNCLDNTDVIQAQSAQMSFIYSGKVIRLSLGASKHFFFFLNDRVTSKSAPCGLASWDYSVQLIVVSENSRRPQHVTK